MTHDRRTFLRRTGAALSVAAATGCVPDASSRGPGDNGDAGRSTSLDPALLRLVGALSLPSALGDPGFEQAVQGFERWAYGYEPVAELNHGYGTSEIRYGPADPLPAWGAQLQALDLEAVKRTGTGFATLTPDARAEILRRQIGDEGPAVPDPLQARHVAVALLAWWLATPDATDRCYGARISPQTCRGIANAPQEPEAVA
ncbi:MAG: hypothetical protein Q8N53_19860 [Longimicrobiales bacterium]|nr:hypothetical protein [Longimicrobiales bacterium]